MINALKNAPARIKRSFRYTWNALTVMLKNEESFRLECIGLMMLLVFLAVWPWPLWKRLAMLGCYMLILLVETLNSAIEDVCDLVTRDHSPLVKNAKNKGALAVLLAIIFNAFALVALFATE